MFAGLDVDETGLFAGTRGRQIAGRFTLIHARPFDYGTTGQKDTWRSLVASMEASLRLHGHQPGTLTGLGEYLFGRTGGMIGSLSQLVRGAAILAIEDGTEQITRELLDLVPVDHAAQRSVSGGPHAAPRREQPGGGCPAPVPPAQARDRRLLAAPPRLRPRPVHRRPARRSRYRPGSPRGRHARLRPRLAAVTGYPPGNLARALPELRQPGPDWLSLRHLAQRACPRCTARHHGGPVRRLFAHHEYLCTRHGYWIGPPDPSRDDPPRPLALQAARTGRRAAHADAAPGGCTAGQVTFDATVAATSICIELRCRTVHQPCGPGGNGAWNCSSPALTGGRCSWRRSSPRLRRSPLSWPPHQAQADLLSAVRHALGYAEPPGRYDIRDALSCWSAGHRPGRFLRPAAVYSHAGHHDDGAPRITDARLAAERQTATRFRRDRRAPFIPSPGPPMPYACLADPLPA